MPSLPKWLDPKAELLLPESSLPRDDRRFVGEILAPLVALGVPEWQRLELAAVAALETGWGTSRGYSLGNACGVKVKREVVEEYARRTNKPQHWFRAKGHLGSGDAPEVLYLAWPSSEMFWSMWLWRHVGLAKDIEPVKTIYREAGRLFWLGDPAWIRALILAGYRGNTSAEPRLSGAVRNHSSIVRRVARLAPASH